ncbi:MAG: hypothetical protein K6F05_00055 [Succinivibrio sp.]|nr:hypothetical protein [Succinivibrio sp.]
MSDSNCIKFALFGDTQITSLNQQPVDPADFRVLQRIPICPKGPLDPEHLTAGLPFALPVRFADKEPGDELIRLILLDTETTGLDPQKDEIIELGMVKVCYAKNRKQILSLEGVYDELNQPQHKLSPQITKLTGITDAELEGRHFNLAKIADFMADAGLVVAHNARFDRPFFDKTFPDLSSFCWACTIQEIAWQSHFDMPSSKLGLMVKEKGFFFEAHRAISDCLALLWLLWLVPEAFCELLDSARQKSCDLKLYGNTYDIKDELKAKFHARFKDRAWFIPDVREERLREIEAFIEDKVAAGFDVGYHVISTRTARERYKSQL